MMTISLPQSVLNKLEQLSRSFVWGSTTEKRRPHLLAWDRCCAPKAVGGLGIRSSRQMNIALLAKLGWRMMNDHSSLWSAILRKKYKVRDIRDGSWLIAKGNWSSTWKSICIGIREGILPGIRWIVGNGREIKFWQDRWLCEDVISDIATMDIPEPLCDAAVHDLWLDGGGWNRQYVSPYISNDLWLQLQSFVVDDITGSKDRVTWGECSNGKLTVTSVYNLLTRDGRPTQNMVDFYERIWHVLVPERVRCFLWLTSHQALMTNSERNRRHLCTSALCFVCKTGDESILHVLRDCPAMHGIWTQLVPLSQQDEFFGMSLFEWLYVNLGVKRLVHGCHWSTLFALATWWGWKWRCEIVFNNHRWCRDRVKRIKDNAKEVMKAYERQQDASGRKEKVERMIQWKPPIGEWFKLNTDGASRGNPGLATAGGVLRDGRGCWCGGFALNIGICSAPLAELWGVYYGLCVAWEKGVMRLDMEVDSEIVVGFLNKGIEETHPLSFLVRLCYGLISKDWLVRISHVYREANRLADGLANYAFELPLGIHWLSNPPECVRPLVLDDANGVASARLITV